MLDIMLFILYHGCRTLSEKGFNLTSFVITTNAICITSM